MIEHTQRGDTQLRVDGGHARCGLAPPSSGCKDEAHQGRSGPRSSTTRCDVPQTDVGHRRIADEKITGATNTKLPPGDRPQSS